MLYNSLLLIIQDTLKGNLNINIIFQMNYKKLGNTDLKVRSATIPVNKIPVAM